MKSALSSNHSIVATVDRQQAIQSADRAVAVTSAKKKKNKKTLPGTDMADSNLMPKRNAKSAIWAYFRFFPDVNSELKDLMQPICTLCKNSVPVKDKQKTNLFFTPPRPQKYR